MLLSGRRPAGRAPAAAVLVLGALGVLGLLGAAGCSAARGPEPGPPAAASAAPPDPAASTTAAPAEASAQAEAAPPPVGSSSGTLTVAGLRRTYRVHRPPSTAGAVPLVVVLHGGFGSAAQAEASYGWDAAADRSGFVVAYPEALTLAWNAGGGCCGPAATADVDDVAFVERLVATLATQLPVDARRIFAAGMSNGGILAYRLACETHVFAAVAPVSATLLAPCPTPSPISVIHVHGTADRTVRYLGGPGGGVARINGPAVPGLVARWRGTDGCGRPAVHRSGAVTTSVATCPQGRSVELVTVSGAGHQWPGARPRTSLETLIGLDPPFTGLDATATIWRFFTAHPAPVPVAAGGSGGSGGSG